MEQEVAKIVVEKAEMIEIVAENSVAAKIIAEIVDKAVENSGEEVVENVIFHTSSSNDPSKPDFL